MLNALRLGALAVLALTSAAGAADIVSPQPPMYGEAPAMNAWRLLDEARIGGFVHDLGSPEEGSFDINAELLTGRLPLIDPASPWVWLSPRLHLGGTLNTAGDTSHAYAGLTWTVDVTQRIFLEGSFGGAIHNGETDDIVPLDRSALGCSPLFRESGSLGFRVTQNWSVMASIEHLSNAGICDENRGLTNYGARIGYRF